MNLHRVDGRTISKAGGVLSAFACIRNERVRLSQFLSHHRRIGAKRFFIVDNASDDGSAEFLISQPDVHLWHTSDSFGESDFGAKWLSILLDEFAHDEWALILDADELLIYPGCEEFEVQTLCKYLDRIGSRAFRTLLLDMYSNKPIRETKLVDGQDVLELCPFFDAGPYARLGDADFGGVRQRVFWALAGITEDSPPCMTNFVLQRWRRGQKLYGGRHRTDLPGMSVSSVTGALLHFKMIDALVTRAAKEVQRKEHWNSASEYAVYAKVLGEYPDLVLFDRCSIRYENSRQLVSMGLVAAAGNFWRHCRRTAQDVPPTNAS